MRFRQSGMRMPPMVSLSSSSHDMAPFSFTQSLASFWPRPDGARQHQITKAACLEDHRLSRHGSRTVCWKEILKETSDLEKASSHDRALACTHQAPDVAIGIPRTCC